MRPRKRPVPAPVHDFPTITVAVPSLAEPGATLTLRVFDQVGAWAITERVGRSAASGAPCVEVNDECVAITHLPSGRIVVRAANNRALGPVLDVFAAIPHDPEDVLLEKVQAGARAALDQVGAYLAERIDPTRATGRTIGHWVGDLVDGWKRKKGART